MKINELLEAVSIPKDEADEIRTEFRSILKDTGVTVDDLKVSPERAIKSRGKIARTAICGYVIPKIKNGEYDADEAEIALRLAHRLISKWLAQKEAGGQPVDVDQSSDVGEGHKFSTRPYRIWAGSKYIEVPGFRVSVSIANKADTRTATEKEDRLNLTIKGYNINHASAHHRPEHFFSRKDYYSMLGYMSKHFYIEGPAAKIKEIRRVLTNGDGNTPASMRKLYAFAEDVLHAWGSFGKDVQLGFPVNDGGRVMYYNYHDNKGFLPISKIHDADLMDKGNPIKTSLNKTRRGMIKIPYDDFVQMLKLYFPNAKV
jgi:hypothetical protein